MDKISDVIAQPKSFGKANANETQNDAITEAQASFSPPVFQLETQSNKPVVEEKEESSKNEAPYQLAAEGSEPPADPSPADNGEVPDIPVQNKANNTGLPDQLKLGVENLSGFSLDDVNVHYNSSKPAQLQAHAYAQGSDIHIGPGQERHLPHEAWHVVQQKQGRVQATTQLKGMGVNDDSALEKEADVMGAKAIQMKGYRPVHQKKVSKKNLHTPITQYHRDVNSIKSQIENDNVSDHEGSGNMEGFGATVGEGDQTRTWSTKVNWGALDHVAKEATSMIAKPIGPDHPSGQRSGSSDDQSKARAQFLSDLTNSKYIQGHLLNDNIGGPASRRNLTAIPGKPGNAAHDQVVEEDIKKEIDEGHWVYYEITVPYQDVQLSQLNPYLENENIPNLKGYDQLPGKKPTKVTDTIRIASSFNIIYFTYQPDGHRASALHKVNIKFPHKVNEEGHKNNETSFGSKADGYEDHLVEFPDRKPAEEDGQGAPAVANSAPWLNLDFELEDTLDASAPNVDDASIAAEVDATILHEKKHCVDVPARKMKYPFEDGIGWCIATQELKEKRPRETNYSTYIIRYKKEKYWNDYRTYLISKKKTEYQQLWNKVKENEAKTPELD